MKIFKWLLLLFISATVYGQGINVMHTALRPVASGGGGGEEDSPNFIITVNTENAGSDDTLFVLPTTGAGFDAWIDWGDGSDSQNITGTPGDVQHDYDSPGTYQIQITGTFPRIYFNDGGDKLKLISIDNWGDIQFTSLYAAFRGCSNMECTATDLADFSLVTSFSRSFQGCSSLVTFNNSAWDVSESESFYFAFSGCSGLTELDCGDWDVASVATFQNAFENCSSLTSLDVGDWNTVSVTAIEDMFSGCSDLSSLDVSGWDVSDVTDFEAAFYHCSSLTSLDVSDWDVSSGLIFLSLFNGCTSLTTIDVSGWNTSNATSFIQMFYNCSSLKASLAGLDLGVGLTSLSSMLSGCNINSTGTANYDATLIKFESDATTNSLTGLTFHGGTSQYSSAGGGTAARNSLTDAGGLNWSITDGGEL